MKNFLLILLALTVSATAQTIVLKDGKIVAAKTIRREGGTIIATVELPATEAGQPVKTGDFGYPIAQIARVDFAEPPPLRTAPDLIPQGKGAEALAQLDLALKHYENFREVPGSWWAELALLKAQVLASLGREKDAEPIGEQITHTATDPELLRAAEVQHALVLVHQGAHEQALEIAERALQESKRPGTLARASVIKGECLLAKKEWEDALLAFLRTPVFYPGEKMVLPTAMLGAGRAQFGMEDFPRARATLDELIKTSGAVPEAALAKAELDKITHREAALAPPK